jgi:putative tricarboxylic transport membrane protein
MLRLNRDTLVAIALLLFCGVAFFQTYAIPETVYNSMDADIWPRFVIVVIAVLSLIYLAESLRDPESPVIGGHGGAAGFVRKYSNAFKCYLLFGFFVVSLPYLGILISGLLFVFLMLTAIGTRSRKFHLIHLTVAVVTVVGFWAIFTFGLQVMLPEGVLF